MAPAPRTTTSGDLTDVELIWLPGRVEHELRFGRPAAQVAVDTHRRIARFAPGAVFALRRRTRSAYGTAVSRIDIVRIVSAGEACQTLPFIRPGGESLLRIDGGPNVERVLGAIAAIEALGVDPADVAPDHWRHVHNRLLAGEASRPYTRAQHMAWQLRRGLTR